VLLRDQAKYANITILLIQYINNTVGAVLVTLSCNLPGSPARYLDHPSLYASGSVPCGTAACHVYIPLSLVFCYAPRLSVSLMILSYPVSPFVRPL
jgi:hypothetical protein